MTEPAASMPSDDPSVNADSTDRAAANDVVTHVLADAAGASVPSDDEARPVAEPEPEREPEPLGVILAARRQALQLTLDDVAARLKRPTRQIAALEAEDWAALPSGGNLRGLLRTYARMLELDGDTVVRALPAAETAVPALDLSSTLSRPYAPMPARAHAGLRMRWMALAVAVAVVGAITVGVSFDESLRARFAAWRGAEPRDETTSIRSVPLSPLPAAPSTGATAAPTAAPTAATSTVAAAPAASAASGSTTTTPLASGTTDAPVAATPVMPPSDLTPSAAAVPVPVATPTPPSNLTPSSTSSSTPNHVGVAAVTTPSAAGVASTSSVARVPAVRLSFTRSSWYRLTKRDGTVIAEGVGEAGATRDFDVALPVDLTLGYAPGAVVEVRGRVVQTPINLARDVSRTELK